MCLCDDIRNYCHLLTFKCKTFIIFLLFVLFLEKRQFCINLEIVMRNTSTLVLAASSSRIVILNLGYGSKNYRIDLLLMKQKKTKPLAVLQKFIWLFYGNDVFFVCR